MVGSVLGVATLVGALGVPAQAARATTTSTVRVATVVVVDPSSGGAVNAVVPIVLDAPASSTVTAHWVTHDVSSPYPAVAGHDYTAAQGTVTFAPGEVQHDVKVRIHKGVLTTAYKDFAVSIDQVTGAAGTNAQALVRLADPFGPAYLEGSGMILAPESAARGKGYTATVTFTLDAPLNIDVTAQYNEPDSDSTRAFFVPKTGTLRIPAGKLAASVKLRLLRPPLDGGEHDIEVVLSSIVGLPFSYAPGIVEIR